MPKITFQCSIFSTLADDGGKICQNNVKNGLLDFFGKANFCENIKVQV